VCSAETWSGAWSTARNVLKRAILSVHVGPVDLSLSALQHCFLTACVAFFDLGRPLTLVVRPRAALAAENLFLRKQLALFQEQMVKPHRADDSTRWMMAPLIISFTVARVSRTAMPLSRDQGSLAAAIA
jgi:hypothetical protein